MLPSMPVDHVYIQGWYLFQAMVIPAKTYLSSRIKILYILIAIDV